MATFSNAYAIQGTPGDWLVSSCGAIRQVQTGVTTVAGQLGTYGNVDSSMVTTALFGDNTQMPFVGGAGGVIADPVNCELRWWVNGGIETIAGAGPATAEVRGTAAASRYRSSAGLVTDGTNAYMLGVAAGGPGNVSTIVQINLATGTSSDLFTFSTAANAITRIGSALFVAMQDGTIHEITTAGTNDFVLAGTTGTTSPPSDGTPGMLSTAVLNPSAITTDGTDLYFFDASKLVRRISLGTATVSLIAGTVGTTDVVDDVGAKAHFANLFANLVYAGGNLYVSDGANPGYFIYPTVIRQVSLPSGAVTTIAGQNNNPGDADGVGLQAQIAAAPFLATDGRSIFISDSFPPPVQYSALRLEPTIRQLVLDSRSLTTMLGQRGEMTIRNGTGTKAIVDHPGPMAFDATTHAIYVFDRNEGVMQKIH
jgi:hypothetical protein